MFVHSIDYCKTRDNIILLQVQEEWRKNAKYQCDDNP